ncbi:hypothetical protein [Thalassoglobus polymorphus]|nr:hypothetical protein [Thalassoglobus polymorphus]
MRKLLCILSLFLTGCHTAGWSGESCDTKQIQPHHSTGMFGKGVKVCVGPDKWKTKQVAHSLANKNMPRGVHSRDFKSGFRQAFEDVAMGASGEVPPLPPKAYWKEKNRTCNGHARADQWFAGYAAGSQVALNIGSQRFLDVASGSCHACRTEFTPPSTYY